MAQHNPQTKLNDFACWKQETLALFAAEAYEHMKKLEAANEQLRKDLHDAMAQLRQHIKDKK